MASSLSASCSPEKATLASDRSNSLGNVHNATLSKSSPCPDRRNEDLGGRGVTNSSPSLQPLPGRGDARSYSSSLRYQVIAQLQ